MSDKLLKVNIHKKLKEFDLDVEFDLKEGCLVGSTAEICIEELDNYLGREIGYVLSKDYWGKGIMVEAVNKVVDYLFNNLKLNISQIFSLYEKIEEKAFDALVGKIKEETKKFESDKINEETENRIKNIINNNSLLNQDLLINGIKKYIVRYFLGDSIRNNPHNLENIKFDDIFNRMDIWGKNIFDDKKFKDESNKLCSLNKKENNNLLMYFYSAIFKKEDKLPTVNEDPNNLSDDEELG